MRLFRRAKPQPYRFSKEIKPLADGKFLLQIHYYKYVPHMGDWFDCRIEEHRYEKNRLLGDTFTTKKEAEWVAVRWPVAFKEWCDYLNSLTKETEWYP